MSQSKTDDDLFGDLFDDPADAAENGSTATAVAEPPPAVTAKRPAAAATANEILDSGDDSPAGEAKSVPSNYLFFDVETIPDYSRESLFDLPPVPQPAVYAGENEGPAPSELVSGTEDDFKAAITKAQSGGKLLPRKILEAAIQFEMKRDKPKPRKGVLSALEGMIAAIDGEQSSIAAAVESRKKKMSVTPEMCQIVSIAWCFGDGPVESMQYSPDEKNLFLAEGVLLRKFWQLAKSARVVCGFNSNGFDLPVVFFRSAMLNITPLRKIDLTPWKGDTCDLMALRWPKAGAMQLKLWASLFGVKVPAGDTDGSQVEEMWRTDRKKLAEYNASDVEVTREIYRRGRGLFWI